jgi:hypothetical protein
MKNTGEKTDIICLYEPNKCTVSLEWKAQLAEAKLIVGRR